MEAFERAIKEYDVSLQRLNEAVARLNSVLDSMEITDFMIGGTKWVRIQRHI